MSQAQKKKLPVEAHVGHIQRVFKRFTLAQRWEHFILIISFSTLLITGLPQKYRAASWSQSILSTPDRIDMIRQIHHIAALLLTAEIFYHLFRAFYLIMRRRLTTDMLPQIQDFKDAYKMLKALLFLSKEKPAYGKYNFEQKFTYWFLFFGLGVMAVTGYIIWFPEQLTLILPGGIVPAAKLAHSTEAIVAGIFIGIWHFYHVHVERLNLSIFTGVLNEKEMKTFHLAEYKRYLSRGGVHTPGGDKK